MSCFRSEVDAMMKPVKMQKVRIFSLRSVLSGLITALHKEGLMEITAEKFEGLDEGRPLEFFNVVSEQLVRMRSINAMMEKHAPKKQPHAPNLLEIEEAIRQSRVLTIGERLKVLTSNVTAKESEISRLKEKIGIVDKLLPFKDIDFTKLDTRSITYKVGEIPAEKLDALKHILDKELELYNLVAPGAGKVALLLYKKSDKNLDQMFSSAGFSILEIPPETTSPITTKRSLEASLKSAEADLQEANTELNKIAADNLSKVNDIIYSLKVEADRAEVASKFGFSRSMVTFEGWVMEKDVPKLAKVIDAFGEKAMLEQVPLTHHDKPPTVLGNPKITSPFEFITNSYSLPNYFEVDPSTLYLVTLPILYGMIVGDVLYGVLSLLLARWLMKKFEKSYIMSNVSKIWYYCAFPTMVWGIIFDEWGGASHSFWLKEFGISSTPLYTGFHRMEEVAMLVAITAIVGILHLTLAFLVGAYNQWYHSKKHAIAKFAWIGVMYGGAIAISSIMFNVFPPAIGYGGLGLLVISTIILVITEGIIGIVELPGLLGNVLSYTRIAAIGIAGVVIAELVNTAFAPIPKAGIMALVFLPVFIVLHVINCFVAMFEALIQGGRLNIVEFRSKFLEGGGKFFLPFSMQSRENK